MVTGGGEDRCRSGEEVDDVHAAVIGDDLRHIVLKDSHLLQGCAGSELGVNRVLHGYDEHGEGHGPITPMTFLPDDAERLSGELHKVP